MGSMGRMGRMEHLRVFFLLKMPSAKLPSTKGQVLQMVERSCANDREAKKLYPNITESDLILRQRLHFARACGYYLAGKGFGGIRP